MYSETGPLLDLNLNLSLMNLIPRRNSCHKGVFLSRSVVSYICKTERERRRWMCVMVACSRIEISLCECCWPIHGADTSVKNMKAKKYRCFQPQFTLSSWVRVKRMQCVTPMIGIPAAAKAPSSQRSLCFWVRHISHNPGFVITFVLSYRILHSRLPGFPNLTTSTNILITIFLFFLVRNDLSSGDIDLRVCYLGSGNSEFLIKSFDYIPTHRAHPEPLLLRVYLVREL